MMPLPALGGWEKLVAMGRENQVRWQGAVVGLPPPIAAPGDASLARRPPPACRTHGACGIPLRGGTLSAYGLVKSRNPTPPAGPR